jgi:hypothetical protein
MHFRVRTNSRRHLLSAVVAGLLLSSADAASASVITVTENFNSYATGDTPVTGFTESNTAAYTIVPGPTTGDQRYRASLSSASGGANASSGTQIAGVVGNNFSVSTLFNVTSFTANGTSTLNLGFGLLGTTANFSDTGAESQYRVLFTIASGTTADVGVVNFQETATNFTIGTGINQQVRGASIGVATGVDYLLTVDGTYNASGHLTMVATATRLDTNASTTSTVTDTTPRAGSFFGYRTALNAAGGSAAMVVNYDNFSLTAVPEPASVGVAGIAALGLLGRRRRAVRPA